MERIILDTNILIEISRNNKLISRRVYAINPDVLYITPIIYSEFLNGSNNKDSLYKYIKFLDKFKILYTTIETDKIFIELFKQYSLSHKPTIPDMLIAATAIHYEAKLFTLNKKDFQFIEGLQLFT